MTDPNQSYTSQSYPGQTYPQYAPPPPPPTNAGWAVAAVIFFWPLAFSAFTHSSNVYPRWAMGDFQGAQYASDRAKKLGQIALWIWVGFMALFVVFYIVLFATLASASNNW
ncbi:CD225/dispanin family protein [Rhodococcus sp. B10]|uniref:CD225/dispanin family protein n=1 Tax=Rhodococcus sp. B10 TaxID=2695876 RepID=UPI001430F35D|nr:CD225/dispanin family protein [Rhodococcus sp. B10]NIL74266.1 hypothetical protein [Rhodococcus sp. B10]